MRRVNTRRPSAPVEPGPRKDRILILCVALGLMIVSILGRAFHLQISRHEDFEKRSTGQHLTKLEVRAERGAILDRNGQSLAVSAPVPSVYAVPSEIADERGTTARLVELLGVEPNRILARLQKKNEFAWIERQVTPALAREVEALKLPGIYLANEPRRYYPFLGTGGAVLGFAGLDGKGLEGVERDFDAYLQGKAYVLDTLRDARGRQLLVGGYLPEDQLSGSTVVTTLDLRIQEIAERSLMKQVADMGARGGFVVVMEPKTGDIVAFAQTPVFNPNVFTEHSPGDWRNRPITDTLEPGSTIKPFLVAAALDAGKVTPETILDGHKGAWQFGRKLIKDVHAVGSMTTYEVVQFSSNIGAVQVGQRLGKELYHSYLRAFGFGEPTGIDMAGEVSGAVHPASKWGQIHLATISYGYGLSVTPLQMARAMAAIANGGQLMRPRIVSEIRNARGDVLETFPPRITRRVLSEATAKQIGQALHMVTLKGGTGGRAVVPGFKVAGKTGTAYKVDPLLGGYSHTKVASSFVGFVPADDPRLVMYVLIDEPTKAQYGGVVAAPVFRMIAQEALPHLGARATEPIVAQTTDEAAHAETMTVDEPPLVLEPSAEAWWNPAGSAVARVTVPDLRGAELASVVRQAAELGVDLEVTGAGVVVEQRPPTGTVLGGRDTLVVKLALPGHVQPRLAHADNASPPSEAEELSAGGGATP